MGCPNVDDMLAEIPSSMLSEWQAYYRLNPHVDLRYLTGHLLALLANIHSGRGQRKFKPLDFLPYDIKWKPRKTREQMEMLLMNAAKMHNAAIKKRKKDK